MNGIETHDHQLSRSVSALLSELLRQYSHLSSNPELYLKAQLTEQTMLTIKTLRPNCTGI